MKPIAYNSIRLALFFCRLDLEVPYYKARNDRRRVFQYCLSISSYELKIPQYPHISSSLAISLINLFFPSIYSSPDEGGGSQPGRGGRRRRGGEAQPGRGGRQMMGGEAQPGRGGRRRTVGYGGDDSMSFVLDYSVNNTNSSPSPPTSRVGFLLIRASIVVLLLLWSYGPWVLWSSDCRPFVAMVLWSSDCRPFVAMVLWSLDCRPFVAMVLGSYGPGLSSFWSYGPWVIVVLLVPPDG